MGRDGLKKEGGLLGLQTFLGSEPSGDSPPLVQDKRAEPDFLSEFNSYEGVKTNPFSGAQPNLDFFDQFDPFAANESMFTHSGMVYIMFIYRINPAPPHL